MVRNKSINLKPRNRREQRKSIYQTKIMLTREEEIQRKKDFLEHLREKAEVKKEKRRKESRVKIVESKNSEIGYSRLAKDIIRKTPGLIREFYRVSKERLKEYKDPNGLFKIKRHLLYPSIHTTNVAYVLSVKYNGRTRKFFVKETNNSGVLERTSGNEKTSSFNDYIERGIDGISESRALSLIEECGVTTIRHHFAFKDLSRKKSYIVYDFVPELFSGVHLKKLIKRKEISIRKLEEIKEYLTAVGRRIEQELKNKKEYGIEEHRIITDALDYDNIYYDLKKDKIFLFDPFLENVRYRRKY